MKVGFCSLLTVLFIGLKLTGYIDWPWFLVVSPIIIGLVLGFILLVVAVIAKALIESK